MMPAQRWILILAALFFAVCGTPGSPADAAEGACSSRAGHDALDAMVGSWDVVAGSGARVAHVVAAKRLDGCMVHVEWSAPGGNAEGLYVFDARRGTWDETWVTTDTARTAGLVHASVQRLDDGGLRFTGQDTSADDVPFKHEVFLRPDGAGRLLQLMRASTDGGVTWSERFRATWTRAG